MTSCYFDDPILVELDLCSREARTPLARCAVQHQYQKGEFIAQYGDAWPYLLLIEGGAINPLRE